MKTFLNILLVIIVTLNGIELQAHNPPIDSIAIENKECKLKMVKVRNEGYSFSDEDRMGQLSKSKDKFYCDEFPVSHILAVLNDTYTKRIIGSENIDYLLRVDYECLALDCSDLNKNLIQQIESYCNFTVKEFEVDSEVWNLSIVDSVKLNACKALKSDRKKGSYTGNEFKNTFEKSAGEIQYSGSDISGLVHLLNSNIKSEIVNTTNDGRLYNLGTIKFKSIEDLKKKLEKRYGLDLNKSKSKINYFKIESIDL